MADATQTAEPVISWKQPMRLVGFARVFTWSNMHEIPLLWQQAGRWLEAHTGTKSGEAFGAIYVPQPGSGDVGYLAGMDMQPDFELTPELTELVIPARKWAVFAHEGGLSDWPDSIDHATNHWLPASQFDEVEKVPGVVTVMERYGPGFDPDTGLGDMECWVALRS